MDALTWLWWFLINVIGVALSIVWFLIGGWVSTLAQIAVVLLLVFGYKYGWRRAPMEILARAQGVGGFVWGWVRRREARPDSAADPSNASRQPARPARRGSRRRQPGDVNLSTMLSLLMLTGLVLAALA